MEPKLKEKESKNITVGENPKDTVNNKVLRFAIKEKSNASLSPQIEKTIIGAIFGTTSISNPKELNYHLLYFHCFSKDP